MESLSAVDFFTLAIFSGIAVLAFYGIMYGLGALWAADEEDE